MRHALILLTLIWLCGCTAMDQMSRPTHDPDFAPTESVTYQAPAQNNGSIYQAGYDMRLFEDIRARRVGDILMVNLVEQTDATKESDTAITKGTSTSVSTPTILGKSDYVKSETSTATCSRGWDWPRSTRHGRCRWPTGLGCSGGSRRPSPSAAAPSGKPTLPDVTLA